MPRLPRIEQFYNAITKLAHYIKHIAQSITHKYVLALDAKLNLVPSWADWKRWQEMKCRWSRPWEANSNIGSWFVIWAAAILWTPGRSSTLSIWVHAASTVPFLIIYAAGAQLQLQEQPLWTVNTEWATKKHVCLNSGIGQSNKTKNNFEDLRCTYSAILWVDHS